MLEANRQQYLLRVAEALLSGAPVPRYPPYEDGFVLELPGFVYPKERQRTGKAGHHYTPSNTRKFEASIRNTAIEYMRANKLKMLTGPCMVHLEIRDQIHSQTEDWVQKLMQEKLLFEHTGGDLDNKEKAVLDGLNKVAYTDDRLVVQVFKYRCYAPIAGFKVSIHPCGITKADLAIIKKHVEYGRRHGQEEGSRRNVG